MLKILRLYFTTLDNPSEQRCAGLNISKVKPNLSTGRQEFTLGTVPTTTTNASVAIGDTSITLVTTDEFPSSGFAYIAEYTGAGVNNSDKIRYTGKTATTLTGIPASGAYSITKIHASGTLVVASATTGDVYANPLQQYALCIIP